jgi:hypothetical protein
VSSWIWRGTGISDPHCDPTCVPTVTPHALDEQLHFVHGQRRGQRFSVLNHVDGFASSREIDRDRPPGTDPAGPLDEPQRLVLANERGIPEGLIMTATEPARGVIVGYFQQHRWVAGGDREPTASLSSLWRRVTVVSTAQQWSAGVPG